MHYGLYFASQAVSNAQAKRNNDDLLSASWDWLTAQPDTVLREAPSSHDPNGDPRPIRKLATDYPAAIALNAAYAYRFLDDVQAGAKAVQILKDGWGFQKTEHLHEALWVSLSASHIYEMVRDHPAMAGFNDEWLARYRQQAETFTAAQPETLVPTEKLFLMTYHIVAGIVLEDEPLFNEGVKRFKHLIDNEIHAEGYLKSFVKNELSYQNQLMGVTAFILAAEAATHAGENLWLYENRGVGIGTAAAYCIYYYFFPEKWKWNTESEALTIEDVSQAMQFYGASLAIAQYRLAPRFADRLLEELSPMFSTLGGLTSLTHHGQPENLNQRKRFWGIF